MTQIVDPPQRIDARGLLRGSPVERAEVVDVEVAASLARKEERRAIAVFDPVERVEGRACSGTARMLASVFGCLSSRLVRSGGRR